MVRKLTKLNSKDGKPYERLPNIESAIEAALPLELATLAARAALPTSSAQHLHSEVLVYLIRKAMHEREERVVNILLNALLKRCMRMLRSGIPDSTQFDAESVREDVISRLSLLFAEEHRTGGTTLDFYEVRFNSALFKLRATILKQVDKELAKRDTRTQNEDNEGGLHEADVRAEDDFENAALSKPEAQFEVSRIIELIKTLPEKEREAFVLHHIYGYQVQSNNPEEETVAKRCGVSGRAIHKRLGKAVKRIPRLKEYMK
jgi:hypothetical protein